MSLDLIRITSRDTRRHRSFFDLVARIFGGLDFALWAERGGWDERYEVLALVDGDRVIASIGRSRMTFLVEDRERTGFQLGAVATAPELRGQGNAARLMDHVLGIGGDAPTILFANDTVLNFYPRFGFERVRQSRFTAAVRIAPAGARPRPVDISDAAERASLAALCARTRAPRGRFSTIDYYPILLWHLTYRPLAAYWLNDGEACAVVSEDEDRVTVHDCLARRPVALDAVVPSLLSAPVSQVRFGFDPAGWWKGPEIVAEPDDQSLLFVRGDLPLPTRHAFRFPDLAQT